MMSSYHDVVVYVGNVAYKPSDNFALELTCTKVGGWQLWQDVNPAGHHAVEARYKLLGGEFDVEPFCIEVAGVVIAGEKPTASDRPVPFGWDGRVER
jgi:hypothetical protein